MRSVSVKQFLDQMEQAKMRWLQHPNRSNEDNLNNIRGEIGRHCGIKKKEYLKAKMETTSTIKKYQKRLQDISDFKKGYRPRTNIVYIEKGDVGTDSYSILTGQMNYFSKLLNVHGITDIRQTEIHTAEPLMPEPCAFYMGMAIEKLIRHITRH
jgi:hypothetical protein